MGVIFEAYSGADSDFGTLSGAIALRALYAEPDLSNSLLGVAPQPSFVAVEGGALTEKLGTPTFQLTDMTDALLARVPSCTFSGIVGDSDNAPVLFYLNGVLPGFVSSFVAHSASTGSISSVVRPKALFSDADSILAGNIQAQALIFEQRPSDNYFSILMNTYAYVDATGSVRMVLSDNVVLGESLLQQATCVIADTLMLSDQISKIITLFNQLSDTVNFNDVIEAILRLHLASQLGLAAVPQGDLLLALALVDRITLTAGLSSTAQVVQLVAAVMALGDRIFDAQFAQLTSGLGIGESLQADILAYAYAIDTLRMNAVPEGTLWLLATASSTAKFLDAPTAIAQLLAAIADGVVLTAALNIGGQPYTAWVMNTETKAMFQYTNYEFNSYAVIGGKPMAASAEGVHELDTGDTDDGAAIIASIRSGLTNFGSAQLKRVERMYMGYTSNGTLCLRVVAIGNNGAKQEYTYKMVEKPAGAPVTGRVPIGGGIKSTYWAFELVNNDGEYFELHDVRVLPMVLTGRLN